MRVLILVMLIFSSFVHAQVLDAYHCRQIEMFSFNLGDDDILDIVSKINDCPTDDEIVLDKVTADYKKYYGADKIISANIKGYKLTGPRSLFKIARNMLGSKPPKGWKEAAQSCDTVICAFTKLFNSEKAAMQAFNFEAKSGYYLSLDQEINQGKGEQIWSAKEVQEMDAAADKLPKHLKNFKLKKIERFADGLRRAVHSNNVAAFASPVPELKFYDSGAKGKPTGPNSYTSTSWPQEVLLHELCHHHDFKYFDSNYELISERRNSTFGKLSSWKQKTKKDGKDHWTHGDHAHFVSNYASSSPAEDYAESCMSYVMYPERLKKKAPEKYEYMKKYVFKGEDFTKKPWVESSKPIWENLENLLAKEDGCLEKVSECLKDLSYSYGSFCLKGKTNTEKTENGTRSWSSSTCGDVGRMIKNSECVKSYKKENIDNISKKLAETDEKFCELGGVGIIQRRKDDVCKDTITDLTKKLKELSKKDLTPFINICERDRDYTKECILDQVYTEFDFKDSEEAQKLINQVAKDKIPNRMSSLGKTLADKKTSFWFTPCLKSVARISHTISQSSDGTTSESYYYRGVDEKYTSGFLGKYIYEGYDRDGINKACALNILEAFKNDGVTVPKSGAPTDMIQNHLKNEISSFENEVIAKIPESIKKCLVIKKCKLKKIKELVKTWEDKNPTQRSGLSTEEFIEDLFQKTKPIY